jgi:hypothetical protein
MTERMSDKEFARLCMQTPTERKNRILLPKYNKTPGMNLEVTDRRTSTNHCTQCAKLHQQINFERRPCHLLQYMEECTKCGHRIGEN